MLIIRGRTTQPPSDAAIPAAQAYAGSVAVAGAASKYSEAQLLNPSASGIVISVRSISAYTGTAAELSIRSHGTALTTDADSERNLYIGGAAATGELRSDNVAANSGTEIWRIYVPANSPTELVNREWALLAAGQGLVVSMLTANLKLDTFWQWRESTG